MVRTYSKISFDTKGNWCAHGGVGQLLSVLAPVTWKLGSLRLFRVIALTYFSLYFVTPYLVLLPKAIKMLAITSWPYGSAPSRLRRPQQCHPARQLGCVETGLGTINGIAASTASLCRALGPTPSAFSTRLDLKRATPASLGGSVWQ